MCSNSYQSCADLRDIEKVEPKKSRENMPLWASGWNPSLYRSRSMDLQPQRGPAGTRALCALFESKAAQESGPISSPTLNSAAAPGKKTWREHPLQDWRGHNNLLKVTANQVRYLSTF